MPPREITDTHNGSRIRCTKDYKEEEGLANSLGPEL